MWQIVRVCESVLTVRSGRISWIFEARMTAAAAAKLIIDLSAGRRGSPLVGRSVMRRNTHRKQLVKKWNFEKQHRKNKNVWWSSGMVWRWRAWALLSVETCEASSWSDKMWNFNKRSSDADAQNEIGNMPCQLLVFWLMIKWRKTKVVVIIT